MLLKEIHCLETPFSVYLVRLRFWFFCWWNKIPHSAYCLEHISYGRTIFNIVVSHYLFYLKCGLYTVLSGDITFMYTAIFLAGPILFSQMLWSWGLVCILLGRALLWGAFALCVAGEAAYARSCLFHRTKNSLCLCTILDLLSLSHLHLALEAGMLP